MLRDLGDPRLRDKEKDTVPSEWNAATAPKRGSLVPQGSVVFRRRVQGSLDQAQRRSTTQLPRPGTTIATICEPTIAGRERCE